MTERETPCPGCGQAMPADDGPVCANCARRYPDSLVKATFDHFDYALGLRTGEIVRFNDAEINGEWVHLTMGDYVHGSSADYDQLPFPFERGIDVRIADIVWCCDAPYGS